jgi:Arc/MetJ family transcription regulator
MRLTINLDEDLYAVAKSLARTEDSTVSAAVNKLLRRALLPSSKQVRRVKNALPAVACDKRFTSENVYELDSETS